MVCHGVVGLDNRLAYESLLVDSTHLLRHDVRQTSYWTIVSIVRLVPSTHHLLSHIFEEAKSAFVDKTRSRVTHRPGTMKVFQVLDNSTANRNQGSISTLAKSLVHATQPNVCTHLINDTIGLTSAWFTYDSSFVNRGMAALRSRNRRSISITTTGAPCSSSS
jgi:hypothetical protein